MSTPAEERAALAEMTANAMIQARTALGHAADAADEVDSRLGWREFDIAELYPEALRVRSEDEPEPFLRNARALADELNERLRGEQRALGEVRDYLEQSGRAIQAGREFLDAMEELPPDRIAEPEEVAERQTMVDQLRERLGRLDRAVTAADQGIERTSQHLSAARGKLEPLLEASGAVDDREQTAQMIDSARTGLDEDVSKTRGELRSLSEGDFDYAQADAKVAAAGGSDLAAAIHAGMNPTPRTAQQTTVTSSEKSPHDRAERGREPGLDL